MSTFRLPLINYSLLKQIDPQKAEEYAQTPEYIGAKTAKDQEVLTKTGALGLAGLLVGGGGLGAFGGGAAGVGGAVGDAAIAGGAGTDALAGGATEALGGGLTAGGTATGAIGGDALGTGLTEGATGATGISGSAASGALAPGYFASETAYPIIGGSTAAAAGGLAGGVAGGAAGGLAAGGLGGLTAADLLRGVPGVLGALAANNQSNQLSGLADKYFSVGAPSRARYEASYAPGFTMNNDPGYTDALNQSAKATLHGLSVTGNPADSPNAWAASLQDLYQKNAYPALQNYRTGNASAGGLAALTGAAPAAATGAISANTNVANSLGGAAADIFTPRKSLSDLLREARL